MIAYPNAKINIGIYITERRSDGFHNIETVMIPVYGLKDILELIPQTDTEDTVTFSTSGIDIKTDSDSNLCVKAYRRLAERIKLPAVAMHLHKQIPFGAGLGGGSADGAFALRMLNTLSSNPLNDKELAEIALDLGSDCPFFLVNTPCLAKGRGEELKPVAPPLEGYHLLLVNPGIAVATGQAYRSCTPEPAPINLEFAIETPPSKWKETISNDFEKTVFDMHPIISDIKQEIYTMGAIYASMSGSGSTVFGIFKDKPDLKNRFTGMFAYICRV